MNVARTGSQYRIAVVGTLNWLDAAVEVCTEAGLEAKAFPLNRFWPAIRWMFSRELRQFNMIYQRGAGGIKYIVAARLLGKPIIKHWIGCDVSRVASGRGLADKCRLHLFKNWVAFHLAVTRDAADELESVGISADVVRTITPITRAEIEPFPDQFTVLAYWTQGRREFYGGDIVLQLARELPDVKFLIVGPQSDPAPMTDNVEFLGYQKDITRAYSRSSVLIRLCEHDGAPNMPLEMLARGRYVIYNRPIEGCHLATDLDETREALAQIRQCKGCNEAGAAFVRDHCRLEQQVDVFRKALEKWDRSRGK